MPNVRGERLDVAERHLDAAGLDVEEVGGGVLGIVVRSRWRVCDQEPDPGRRARTVRLIVARECPYRPVPPAAIVPEVRGSSLAAAERLLDRAGIRYQVVFRNRDDEGLGVELLEVCEQSPPPGTEAGSVVLSVERSCHV